MRYITIIMRIENVRIVEIINTDSSGKVVVMW